jgi:hypothetical protein
METQAYNGIGNVNHNTFAAFINWGGSANQRSSSKKGNGAYFVACAAVGTWNSGP